MLDEGNGGRTKLDKKKMILGSWFQDQKTKMLLGQNGSLETNLMKMDQ